MRQSALVKALEDRCKALEKNCEIMANKMGSLQDMQPYEPPPIVEKPATPPPVVAVAAEPDPHILEAIQALEGAVPLKANQRAVDDLADALTEVPRRVEIMAILLWQRVLDARRGDHASSP